MFLLAGLSAQIMMGVVPQWVLWTMLAGTATLVFAALAQAFPVHLIGRVYTAFNLLGFMTTASVQWYVGYVLDQYPDPATGYKVAFFGLLGLQIVTAGWFVMASRFGFGRQTMLQKQGL